MDFIQQNWYWVAMAVISGGLLIGTGFRGRSAGGVTPAEATQLINREDAVVIDVREAGEFAAGHIPNARHIPLGELSKRMTELEKLRERNIVVNCQSGGRSGKACGVLRKAGFEKVHNLDGGIGAWEQAGLPVSKKRK
ncbi:MAG: rhodanese-like domain-containing protein [Zoogloea sp.]|nr:rhodanese-like domain-containing protein [Zoogloea sp.]